jgi:SAM-dependent methyltransferase
VTTPFLQLLSLALAEGDLRAVRDVVRRSLHAEDRTLEIGCGPGLFADLFATGDYVGVDPRPPFVDYARRHRPGAFICDELHAVGLPNARFDQALGLDVLGPGSDAAGRAIAAEIKRLLVPAGRALLVERARSGGRVERLSAAVGRIERREVLKSGRRDRVAFLLST